MNKTCPKVLATTAVILAYQSLCDAAAEGPPGSSAKKPIVVSPDALSPVTMGKIQAWINRVTITGGNAAGPSSDPDYSEFWVESRPRPEPTPPEDPEETERILRRAYISAPLTDKLKAELETAHGMRETVSVPLNTHEFLRSRLKRLSQAGTAWSEEVWTEITPEFAEMVPEPPPEPESQGRRTRNGLGYIGELTISGRDRGRPVGLEYYQEVLSRLERERGKK